MGGTFSLSQLDPTNQQAQQTAQPDPTQQLEQQGLQSAQGLGQTLQQNQQPDPLDQIKQTLAQQYQQNQPRPAQGGRVKQLLQSFVSGAGNAMLHDVGLPTPEQEQSQRLTQLNTIQQTQSLDQLRQSQEQHTAAMMQNYIRTPAEPELAKFGIAPGTMMTPTERVQAMMAYGKNQATVQASQTRGVDAAQINATAKAANPSAAARDNRYIDLMGKDPSTWSGTDRDFVNGYNKYVDVTKTQPGIARANVMAAPRWAALDPERQAQLSMARAMGAGVYSDQLTSFNALLGHLGDLKDNVSQLNNLDARFLNTPINKIKQQTGNPAVTSVLAKMEPVRKEFESLLLNNRALYDADRQSADTILSLDSSPAQLQAAMKSMAHTASIRLGSVNSTVKRVVGSDIPGIVEPSAGAVLHEFGEDIPDYEGGGKSFTQVFQSPQMKKIQGKPAPSGGNRIPITRLSDGAQGTILEQDFDSSKYKRR